MDNYNAFWKEKKHWSVYLHSWQINNKTVKSEYCPWDQTFIPDAVVAVTDLKSQMTKATR